MQNSLQKISKAVNTRQYNLLSWVCMYNSLQDIEQKNHIIRLYQKVYTIIFKKTPQIILICISLLIAIIAYNQQDIVTTTELDIVTYTTIQASYKKLYEQTNNNKDLTVYLKQWPINMSGNHIYANNNIILYKWFVLPYYANIFTNSPIPEKSYFDKGQTQNTEIDMLLQNIFLTKPISLPDTVKRISVAPSSINTLEDIQCISKTKLLPTICNTFIQKFIDNMYMYDLSIESEIVLPVIQDLVSTNKRKNKTCRALVQNIQYTNKIVNNINTIINGCDNTIKQQYILTRDYLQTQNEIISNTVQNTVYTDNILNIFKLVSLQQAIYNDIQNNIFNTRRIDAYLYFVQNMLQKKQLTGTYIDTTYWFNNVYILPYAYDNNTNTTIETINSINKGSYLLWFTGLTYILNNQNIRQQAESYTQIDWPPLSILVNSIKNTPYFKVTNENIEADEATVVWFLQVNSPTYGNKILPTTFVLTNTGSRLIVKQATISGYNTYNTLLANLMQSNTFTFGGLYQFINDTLPSYFGQTIDIDICERIKNLTNELITICDNNLIQIQKGKNRPEIYNINISGYNIVSIQIQDTTKQTQINQAFGWIQSDFVKFPALIAEIAEREPSEQIAPADTNILRIIDRVQTYLQQKPTNISTLQDMYFIEIMVNKIAFIAEYDIQTHSITSLYFKDAEINNKPIGVNNIQLELSDVNQATINTFMNKPLDYIKNISQSTYLAYLQFIRDQ